jgi:hypothetical protein
MTTPTRMQMPSLVSTIPTHQQEEMNVVEESNCNCSHPMWKLAFRVMATKVLQIASWVPVHSLP